jgi:hypothetical protein
MLLKSCCRIFEDVAISVFNISAWIEYVPGDIPLCKVLIAYLVSSIVGVSMEEQADFRKGRGCIDNMFAIRNIIEQCTESKTPLFINYIDFKKAFDSVSNQLLLGRG